MTACQEHQPCPQGSRLIFPPPGALAGRLSTLTLSSWLQDTCCSSRAHIQVPGGKKGKAQFAQVYPSEVFLLCSGKDSLSRNSHVSVIRNYALWSILAAREAGKLCILSQEHLFSP